MINGLELVERGAYYGTIAILGIHLHDNLGFSAGVTGMLTGTLMALLYFVPLIAAALAEKIGYRKALIGAFFFMIGGYMSFGFFTDLQMVVLSIFLLGIGAGSFKPLISATIAHVTRTEQRNAAFSIYYWMINLGAFLVPLTIGFFKTIEIFDPEKNSEQVFFLSAALISINLLITIFRIEDPITPNPDKDIFGSLKTLITVAEDRSFVYLLLIYSGFWFMFGTAHIFMPIYMKHFHIMPSWFSVFYLAIINPGTIISVGFYLSKVVEKYDSLHLMITGVSIFVFGILLLGMTAIPIFFVAGIILFSIGEFITHPNFISYVSKIAPEDKVAVYMGYAFIPAGIGQVGGNFIGGFIFGHFAESMEMPKIFWAIIASYGLLTITGLVLYDIYIAKAKQKWAGDTEEEIWDEEPEDWDHYEAEEEVARKPSPVDIRLPFIADTKWNKFVPAILAIILIPIVIGGASLGGKNTWYEEDDDDDDKRFYYADVNLTHEILFDEVEEVVEGETLEGEGQEISYQILRYDVNFSWNDIDNDVGPPDVRLEVWSSNDSRDPVDETRSGFTGAINVNWTVNSNTNLTRDNFTIEAKSESALYEELQHEPEDLYVRATYVNDNNPTPGYDERLEFTLTITVVTWELENLQKVKG